MWITLILAYCMLWPLFSKEWPNLLTGLQLCIICTFPSAFMLLIEERLEEKFIYLFNYVQNANGLR